MSDSATKQGPRTIGPNLAELTMRERAATAWAQKASEGRRKAERDAQKLALTVFGVHEVEFDDFVPEDYARRHKYQPRHLVTFEVEGLEFCYVAAHRREGENVPECFELIDRCPCGRGIRILAFIWELVDLGWAFDFGNFDEKKCEDCKKDDRRRKERAGQEGAQHE